MNARLPTNPNPEFNMAVDFFCLFIFISHRFFFFFKLQLDDIIFTAFLVSSFKELQAFGLICSVWFVDLWPLCVTGWSMAVRSLASSVWRRTGSERFAVLPVTMPALATGPGPDTGTETNTSLDPRSTRSSAKAPTQHRRILLISAHTQLKLTCS